MPITFDTYLIRPLIPGGTGQVQTAVNVSGDTLERIVVKLGATPASAWDDPTLATVEVPVGENGELFEVAFTRALPSASVVASWFAKLSTGGWVAGPVVSNIDLRPKYASVFPWLKPQVLDLLKQLAAENPPNLTDGRTLAVRGAFPRDTNPLPCFSIQVTATPTGIQLVGDSESNGMLLGKRSKRSRGYNVTIDIIGWTDQPEEREEMAPWLGSALSVLIDTLPYFGAHEPTFSVNESEDFETLKVPTFMVTGSINFTAFSELSYPVPTSYGHLTLIQEAP